MNEKPTRVGQIIARAATEKMISELEAESRQAPAQPTFLVRPASFHEREREGDVVPVPTRIGPLLARVAAATVAEQTSKGERGRTPAPRRYPEPGDIWRIEVKLDNNREGTYLRIYDNNNVLYANMGQWGLTWLKAKRSGHKRIPIVVVRDCLRLLASNAKVDSIHIVVI